MTLLIYASAQRCCALSSCVSLPLRHRSRAQKANRRGGRQCQPPHRSSSSHWCRAEAPKSAGEGAGEDSDASSRPAVTDAQRRAALRLPPLPLRTEQPSGSGPPGGGLPSPESNEQERGVLERLVIYLGGAGGLRGSGALLLAYWLHLDAFGGLHWNGGDLALGLALSAPIICIDAALMLSDVSEKREFITVQRKPRKQGLQDEVVIAEQKQARRAELLLDGNTVAKGLSEASEMLLERIKEMGPGMSGDEEDEEDAEVDLNSNRLCTTMPQSTLAATVDAYQRERINNDQTMNEPAWVQGTIIAFAHLPDEMLLRAVGLTVTAGWVRDRLFEGGLDNVVDVAGYAMPTVELGGWIALGIWSSYSMARAVLSLTAPSAVKVLVKEASKKGGQLGSSKSKVDRQYREQLKGLMARMVRSNRNARALAHVRDAAETAVLGGAFLLTGNLLASYSAAVTIDGCYTIFQHVRAKQLMEAQMLMMKAVSAQTMVREAVKAKRYLHKLQAVVAAKDSAEESHSTDNSADRPEGQSNGAADS